MKGRICFSITLMLMMMIANEALAGWVIQERTRFPDGEQSSQTIYIQGNKSKIVNPEQVFISDIDAGLFYLINPRQKIYTTGRPEELQRSVREVSRQMMEEELKRMPPEMREEYRREMQEMEGGSERGQSGERIRVDVKRTGQQATVAGYRCQNYEILVDGKRDAESCISTELDIRNEIDMRKLEDFFGMTGGSQRGSYETSPAYRELMERGYELRTVEFGYEGERIITEVTNIERRTLSPSTFQVPQGYRRVSIRQFVMEDMKAAQAAQR